MTVKTCKGCGAPIVWITTTKGKAMPCNAEAVDYQENKKGASLIVTEAGNVVRGDIITGGGASPLARVVDGKGYISHYATCPAAVLWITHLTQMPKWLFTT